MAPPLGFSRVFALPTFSVSFLEFSGCFYGFLDVIVVSNILCAKDSFHFCTHESHFCPMPPCDKMNGPEICAHYYCRQNGNNPGPANRECTFIGNCEGDQDCIATASYLGVETTSSSTSDSTSESTGDSSTAADDTTGYATEYYNTTDADTTYSTSVGTGSRSNSGNVVASSHWAAYAVLGSVLTAFLLVVIWRKRVSDWWVNFMMLWTKANLTLLLLNWSNRARSTMINWVKSWNRMARTSAEPLLGTIQNPKGTT